MYGWVWKDRLKSLLSFQATFSVKSIGSPWSKDIRASAEPYSYDPETDPLLKIPPEPQGQSEAQPELVYYQLDHLGTPIAAHNAKIRRLIQQRKRDGKTYHFTPRRNTPINKEKLLQMYENEIKRRQLMATQAEFCQQQLLIILSGLNRLFEDNHFKTLLRAERIVDMPENLSKCLNHYRETYINESA